MWICYSACVDYLSTLNFEQKEAVTHTNGPLLILAGAGAGKTKTVTHRILHLIKQGSDPSSILAITFTNKAAKEMRERIHALIAKDAGLNLPLSHETRSNGPSPFVSTFHALGVHIIKENARLFGLTRNFSIIDKSDSTRIVKEAVQEEGLDPKQFDPAKIMRAISREKGNMNSLDRFKSVIGREFFSGLVARVWQRYEAALLKEQALDFDDLLLKTATLLSEHKDILEKYQNQWKYVHVDEYQDTNKVQYMITKMLAAKDRNLCVVGDIDQNIYSWRGADIKNILDFEKDYPDARTILLEQNYRSTQTILTSANEIIKKNKKRREKNLYTNNAVGDKIGLFEAYDETEEAHFIAEQAKALLDAGTSPEEIAVLFRANFQSRALEEAFLAHSVPYQLLGTRFYERKEVKDVLSYIKVALNRDAISDLKRVINSPARGLGKVALLKILSGQANTLAGKTLDTYNRFCEALDSIKITAEQQKPSTLIKFVLKASGIEQELKNGNEEDIERLENLQELVTLATRYDYLEGTQGIEKMLEDAALHSDQDEMDDKKPGVKLMTVHASKGLEFDAVFISGLEDELFPHKRLNEERISEEQEEEERRLFYVALTRAKKKVFLTYAGNRMIFGTRRMGMPSEFISDIPDGSIELIESRPNAPRRERVIFFD